MSLLHNNAIKSVALPAAAATASTAVIDLGPTGGAHIPNGRFKWSVPATPSLVDAKKITCSITHCATLAGSYVQVPGYGNQDITGVATSQGGPATEFRMPIAAHVLQYVKFTFAVESGGGSNVAVSGTGAVEL